MKINLKIFANPYFVFSFVWLVCLYFYSLRWALIYPVLSNLLLFFAAFAIVGHAFLGVILNKLSNGLKTEGLRIVNLKRLMIITTFFWFLHFAYSGIPLVNLILGRDFDHTVNFGIPTLIVFSISFSGFFAIASFHNYLQTSNKTDLFYCFANISFLILIVSRGTVFLTILSGFFLWLYNQRRSISILTVLAIAASSMLMLYIFGVAGNYRTKSEILTNYGYELDSKNFITTVADASPEFQKNLVPNEYMWAYLYLTSPIGNLQENINKAQINFNSENTIGYVVNQFTPDFISKRIQSAFGIKKLNLYMFAPQLSVPTTFAEAYLYLGWTGIIIYLFTMLVLPILYYLAIRKLPFWKVGMSVMCCIYFFSIFDNMFIFSGLSLQLIYPFFFLKKKLVFRAASSKAL